MKDKIFLDADKPKMRKSISNLGKFRTALYVILLAVFAASCAKEVVSDQTAANPLSTAVIAETLPVNLADTVAINPVVAVTFQSTVNPTDVSASTITLLEGTTPVQGTVSVSSNTATFTPTADLKPNTSYTATVKTTLKGGSLDNKGHENEHSWSFKTGTHRRANSLSVVSVLPLNSAVSVAVAVQPTVTFSEDLTASTIKTTKITLKQGSTTVAGSVTYSGKVATFKPDSSLTADKVYTGSVTFGAGNSNDGEDHSSDDKSSDISKLSGNFTWSFTTGVGVADLTAPTVSSALPANNATAVAITSKPTVTFSKAMDATTITAATFTLKQGTTVVAGTVSYAGNTATFTPTASLTANLVYTGTITTGAKDAAGNAIAAAYSWSFTTATGVVAEVTPPTVLAIVPATVATSIALTSNVTATFSEAMTASTISSSTFTVSQGSTAVAGTVAYSGTTATFTPTSALVAGLVYTATITAGAKDASGNAIAAAKTWSFTTAAAVANVTSWATQVWPIIQSKCTPCHGATGGSAGINLSSYAMVSAKTNAQIDNSSMYSKMGVTAAEKVIIQAWITQGKLNN
jgi:hypothetical protein